MHFSSSKFFSLALLLAATQSLFSQQALSRNATKSTLVATNSTTYAGLLSGTGKAFFKPSQDAQFYILNAPGKITGYLYSETQNWGGKNRGPCLLTWFNPKNGHVHTLKTIGADEFEAETCGKLEAIGLLDHQQGETVEIGAIYSASSPNAESHEPIVMTVDLSTDTIGIDSDKSRKASESGATTLSALRKTAGN